jgi:hypothetical protein
MCRRLASLTGIAAGAALIFAVAGPATAAPGDPFPPGGTDTLTDTSGTISIEVLEGNIYDLNPEVWSFPIQPGPPNTTVVVREDPTYPGGLGYVQMEMTQLDLVASDSFFDVFVRLNPTQSSMGYVQEYDPGPSDFPAESFFDVYVEVEIPGLTPSTLTHSGAIPLEALSIVELPPWDTQYETPTTWGGEDLYDGAVWTGLRIIGVIHIIPPRQLCEPDPEQNYQWCRPVDCEALGYPPGYYCHPKVINHDPINGSITVIECECIPEDYCHITHDGTGAPPSCTGNCPPPQICVEYQQDVGDGTFDYWCQCEDPQDPCDITPDLKACAGTCPPATPDCRPTRLIRAPGGAWQVDVCECVDPNNDCWLGYDEINDQVWCEGICPAPLECTLMSRGAPQGYIEFWCECHEPDNPPLCGPVQGLACEGACPPDEACVPVEWTEVAPGDFDITDCECRGFDECRGMGDLLTPPTCQGPCPAPEVCTMNQPTPQTYRCDCEAPQVCEPDPAQNYQWCTPVDCQALGYPPGYYCHPQLIEYEPTTGVYTVLECECIPEDHCHITPGTGGLPPECAGGCPTGFDCRHFSRPSAAQPGWLEVWCQCDCICGDINHSGGAVDLNDFAVFALCYGYTAPNAACPPAEFDCSDMDQNGVIDLNDFATFATLFGLTSTHSPPNCHLP